MPDEAWTCGKGLASNAPLPERLGAVAGAMAELFEAHIRAVQQNDADSEAERRAYLSLARRYATAAEELAAASAEMSGYRELPMAPHDMHVMMDGGQRAAFERVVAAEEALLSYFDEKLPGDRQALSAMREAEPPA